ncbi:hypothetical protein DFA_06020 [Cavenderia fasciculata]|uniref:Transmembrane protein 66 n=1 Tax=Cavenderia fasciculata TaxID=261658 RepID=F4PJV8_CACFS|nr:uncharacterized protein DFA_06020 [Cavenderia fasciculata]EGG23882.1 hypothetical protein DFA_06020 [Cavenderia fasciculata]|eukprot:XP_004361733.1 hypothetical protein DFA_06020 [Cavenderia fasciculata]
MNVITTFIISFIVLLLLVIGSCSSSDSAVVGAQKSGSNVSGYVRNPILRFSRTLLTPDSTRDQLKCVGGTARSSPQEEPPYIFCIVDRLDIYDKNATFVCQNPVTANQVTLYNYKVYCEKDPNDPTDYTFGDDHPCYAEFHMDWVQGSKLKVLGWGTLGVLFFYLLLNRNQNTYYQQINNPMSFPREASNPKYSIN